MDNGYRCDGKDNCGDGSDEVGCGECDSCFPFKTITFTPLNNKSLLHYECE